MTWAVAFTKPASELMAAQAVIERAGCRSYCPVAKVILRGNRPGKGAPVMRPLFPRYIFVEIEAGQFVSILYARGIIDLIRDADQRPRTIADEIVEDLRERERAGEFDEGSRERVLATYRPGSEVMVDREWGRVVGTLIALDGESRALVLLNMLGRDVRATIGLDKLKLTA